MREQPPIAAGRKAYRKSLEINCSGPSHGRKVPPLSAEKRKELIRLYDEKMKNPSI